jgi:segregation and condensation protein B
MSETEMTEATLDVHVADLRPALEAVLMVADQPLESVTLATAVGYPEGEVTDALAALATEYTEQGRGFDLRNIGGGWRYYTRDEYAAVVEGFVLDGQRARLTQAALETLAVVAYKQPISRARVSAIRGVNVDGVMRTLLTRGLVQEAGQDHETGANLYSTTGYFLERIGVTSLDELPELAPYLPDMDDLEDELAEMAAPAPEAAVASEQAPEPEPEPEPEHPHQSPHSGDGTEPDGGTEPS